MTNIKFSPYFKSQETNHFLRLDFSSNLPASSVTLTNIKFQDFYKLFMRGKFHFDGIYDITINQFEYSGMEGHLQSYIGW